MSNGDRWMPLYVADYLGDTMHLTGPEHGAYLLLLMHYWRNGPLPDDDRKLAHIARTETSVWKSVGPVVREFFTLNGDGTLHQKRMDWELRRWGEISEKRSAAGKLGGAGRHRSHPSHGGGGNEVTRERPSSPNAYIQPSGNASVQRVRRPYNSQTTAQNVELRARRLAEARVRGTHTEEQWRAVLDVCGHRCLMCGASNPSKDHILSLYLGGSDAIENLQPLCRNCNAKKGPDSTDLRPQEWSKSQPNGKLTAKQTPSKLEANASQNEANANQMSNLSSDFACPPVPVQREDILLSSQEKCAREAKPGETGQDFSREPVRLPSDALKELMATLPPLADAPTHQERNHTLDVQRAAAAKPQRSKACYVTGPTLAALRKQAGIWVAPQ